MGYGIYLFIKDGWKLMPILDHRTDEESQDGKAVNDQRLLWWNFVCMRTVKICANAVLLKHIKVYLLAIRSLVLKSLENQQYDCLWVGAYLGKGVYSPFKSLCWSTRNFSLHVYYPYIIKQTGNENTQTYQVEVVILI